MASEKQKTDIDIIFETLSEKKSMGLSEWARLNSVLYIDYASNVLKAKEQTTHHIFFKKDTDGGYSMVALNKKFKIHVDSPFVENGVIVFFSDEYSKAWISIVVPLNEKYLNLFTEEAEKDLENLITCVILTDDYFISHLQYKVFDLDNAAKEWTVAIERALDKYFMFLEKK